MYPPKKKLEKLLDDWWRQRIRDIWEGKLGYRRCAVPGCMREAHDAHHIFSRRHKGTRWLEKNGIMLCSFHHTLDCPSFHNPHIQKPNWAREVLANYYTDAELDELDMKAKSNPQYKQADLYVWCRKLGLIKEKK